MHGLWTVCKGMLNADIEACEEVGGSRRGGRGRSIVDITKLGENRLGSFKYETVISLT